MLDIIAKRIEDIVLEDIHQLIVEFVSEGDQIEYKRTLPSKKGDDPWIKGEDRIGDYARNNILEEVVGFANAHGGTLLIGLEETKEKPARASDIVSVPKATELVERIKLQIRDCIDPPLILCHVHSVATGSNDDGIILIRVPASPMAPHKLKPTNECYIRRSDRTEKMSMREIQDLTLSVARRLETIDSRFVNLREKFLSKVKYIPTDGTKRIIAVRAACVPILGDTFVDNIFRNRDAHPVYNPQRRIYEKGFERDIGMPLSTLIPTPILRGVRLSTESTGFRLEQDVYANGDMSFEVIKVSESQGEDYLFSSWFLGNAWNAIESVYKFRKAAGVPDIEFGVELEVFFRPGGVLKVDSLRRSGPHAIIGEIHHESGIFPRYSIRSEDELEMLIIQSITDLYNSCGIEPPDALKIKR